MYYIKHYDIKITIWHENDYEKIVAATGFKDRTSTTTLGDRHDFFCHVIAHQLLTSINIKETPS